jgi:small subunit ribosomal protein S1
MSKKTQKKVENKKAPKSTSKSSTKNSKEKVKSIPAVKKASVSTAESKVAPVKQVKVVNNLKDIKKVAIQSKNSQPEVKKQDKSKTTQKPKTLEKKEDRKPKSSKGKGKRQMGGTKIQNPNSPDNALMKSLLSKNPVDLKTYRQGELIEGIVVSLSPAKILLDIGAKSEGVVRKAQMSDSEKSYKDLTVGDSVLVMVEQDENKQGFVELSLKKAESERKWKDLDTMFAEKTPFKVVATQYNKGGLICDAYGMQGFVPISHLDSSRFAEVSKQAKGSQRDIEERMQPLIGKELTVVVIELDRKQNRLVLSEKLRDSAKAEAQKEERLSEITVGKKVNGVVSGVVPFGLFVDLNGVEGLVHVSEIAWEKVENPSAYYNVGDKIEALVLDINEQKGKVGLSLKQLKENPWEKVAQKYPENTKVKGTVTRLVAFGAFVEIEKGLEGLVHVSEMATPLKEGDKVEALVTIVDPKEQRLGLSTTKASEKQMYK